MNLLVVEDDPHVADFLQRGLRAEGYKVQTASDGQQALGMVRNETFAVVLLDVMLPKMSGIEVCQRLRADCNPVPVLMLTAMSIVQDRVTGLRCGADDYLVKPFAFDELLARIESLMRRPVELNLRPAQANQLMVADLVFDRQKMQVRRSGAELTLTAKELALLELLMSAPGRLFSREPHLVQRLGEPRRPPHQCGGCVHCAPARQNRQAPPHQASLIQTMRGWATKSRIQTDGHQRLLTLAPAGGLN